jgi:hypothetical protein
VYENSKFKRNPQYSRRYSKILNLEEILKIQEGMDNPKETLKIPEDKQKI